MIFTVATQQRLFHAAVVAAGKATHELGCALFLFVVPTAGNQTTKYYESQHRKNLHFAPHFPNNGFAMVQLSHRVRVDIKSEAIAFAASLFASSRYCTSDNAL